MGEVVGAGLLAHVPTIMLPLQERQELNEGREISLVPGLEQLRAEVFDVLEYDTVVVFDSHWFTTVEFVISAHDVRAGLFTSDELPRGMCRIPYDWRGDPELAHATAALADMRDLLNTKLRHTTQYCRVQFIAPDFVDRKAGAMNCTLLEINA